MFDVTWIESGNHLGENLQSIAGLAVSGAQPVRDNDRVKSFNAQEITMRTKMPVDEVVNGEIALSTPVQLYIDSRALKVIVG